MKYEDIDIKAFEAKHLPIIRAFCDKLELIEEIDKRISGDMETSPGRVVLAMIQDALSGRSPLFRLKEFFQEKDTELLLGKEIDPEKLGDRTLGRVLDRLYEYGTQKIFTAIAVKAAKLAKIENSFFYFDTTSVRVWGDFDPRHDDPILLTYGFSKDKRPDLKQFVFSLLTIKGGLPVRFSCEDGNSSDKNLNKDILGMISNFLSENDFPGMKAYVADSALVSKGNLNLLEQIPFITRLPATYKEHDRVIAEAVSADKWEQIGILAENPQHGKRNSARYKALETSINLHGEQYRAAVYHSSNHDRRKTKALKKKLENDEAALNKRCKELEKKEFFCKPDAEEAAKQFKQGKYYKVETFIQKRNYYGKGRPPENRKRKPKKIRFFIKTNVIPDNEAIERKEKETGCFVLFSHKIDKEGGDGLDAKDILKAYKESYNIEKNFGFLKDPMILDSLFLKLPRRIEALGLVLILALLVWRLIQFIMRRYINQTGRKIEGWKSLPTNKPTSFMMTTKFVTMQVITINNIRRLGRKPTKAQLQYLQALGLSIDIYLNPPDG